MGMFLKREVPAVINSISRFNALVPVGNKCLVVFSNITKWSVTKANNVCVSEMRIGRKPNVHLFFINLSKKLLLLF